MMYKGLVIGDLHISDKHSARHKNYWEDCMDFLNDITQTIRKHEITHLFLTSDLIGRTTEKNLQHRESLMAFTAILQLWNRLTNNNVYACEGNHDVGANLTDFQMFVTWGLLKRDKTVDVGDARFHVIDYGDHDRAIEFDPDKYNVAVMHTNLQVEGETNWFIGGNDGVELSSLENLYGVEMVIAGHIHTPSERLVTTSIRDKSISLFYPGCGTRPIYDRNVWTKVFGIIVTSDEEGEVNLDQEVYTLKPDIWNVADITQEVVEEIESTPTMDIEKLASILEELKNYNMVGQSDFRSQIMNMGSLDKEAVDLALSYMDKVETRLRH